MRIDNKIKVFISSNCGDEKFRKIRKEIKTQLVSNELISVYLFEDQASTFPTEISYCLKVDDSDVCIFLLEDTKIPVGVQKEIARAKNTQKKSLYYFLGETTKDVIALQHSLIESKQCVFRIVDSFDEFMQCVDELGNEIADIYHYYCRGMVIDKNTAKEQYVVNDTNYVAVPKSILKNSDRCENYLKGFVFSDKVEIKHTDDFDLYCSKFLDVLFSNKNINDYNVSLLLESIKDKHSKEYFDVVQLRWYAIQKYFLGDKDGCLNCLNSALTLAEKYKIPEWMIKDIIIDIRNTESMIYNERQDRNVFSKAETKLTYSSTPLFYPVLDRCDKQFYEELLNHSFKEKLKSPFTISFGSGLVGILNNIVSSYMVSMLYGSLTHIRNIYDRLRYCAFYLCNNYSNWSFRLALCKLMVVASDSKDVAKMIDVFNDILDKINDVDAKAIYDFSKNIPTVHEQKCATLSAFSNIGRYLNDVDYIDAENTVLNIMDDWLNNYNHNVGHVLLAALINNSIRMNQNKLLQFSIKAIKNDCNLFYNEIFRLLSNLNFSKCESQDVKDLLCLLKERIQHDDSCSKESYFNDGVCVLLATIYNNSEHKDDSLIEVLKEKYYESYKNYFASNMVKDEKDFCELIQNEVKKIKNRNSIQGKNGVIGYVDNPYGVIKNIVEMAVDIQDNEVCAIIDACFETLLARRQTVDAKIDAIELLLLIYSEKHNNETICNLGKDFVNHGNDLYHTAQIVLSNLSCEPLKFGFFLFKVLLKLDYSEDVDYQLSDVLSNDNVVDQVKYMKLLDAFLSNINYIGLEREIKVIIKNSIIYYLQTSNKDVRYCALKALLKLLPFEKVLCMKYIYEAINNGNCYEKNLIIMHLKSISKIDKDAYDTILGKCLVDSDYHVRINALKAKN